MPRRRPNFGTPESKPAPDRYAEDSYARKATPWKVVEIESADPSVISHELTVYKPRDPMKPLGPVIGRLVMKMPASFASRPRKKKGQDGS